MAGLRLGGLASGMDTEGVIAQLMAVEALPKQRFVLQQKFAEGRKTALEDVARQLRSLSTAVADLRSLSTWGDVQTLTSSDPAKVAVRQTGAAPPGNATITVTSLARVEQHFYEWNSGPGAAFAIDSVPIDTTGVTTPEELAAKINSTDGVKVFAGVMAGQLVLTGKELGAQIAVTDGGTLALAREVGAEPTVYAVNGVPQPSTTSSVVQPPGLPGVELTLKDIPAGGVTISITPPGADTEKVKAKLKTFVDAYNATIDLVRGKLTEQRVRNPAVAADFVKGQLRGDPALSGMLSSLREALGPVADVTATVDTLAELGIGIEGSVDGVRASADALAGKLKLDETKLAAALAGSAGAVETLLGAAGTPGIAQRLEGILDPVAKTTTGYLARTSAVADADITSAKTRQTDFDRRMTLREERLRSMFSAMEAAMNASQTQSSWLSGQLSNLPTWGS